MEDIGVGVHQPLEDLQLPDGAIVALVSRDKQLIPPRGATKLQPGDYLYVIVRTGEHAEVDEVFRDPSAPRDENPSSEQ